MRIGVSSIVFLNHLDLLEHILSTTNLLEHVEMYFSDRFPFFHEKLNEFRHLHYEHGITYSLHLPSHGRSNQACISWKDQKKRKLWSLDLGRRLDMKDAVVHVPCQHVPPQPQCATYQKLMNRLVENLGLLSDECRDRGMTLYLENTLPNLFFHDHEHFEELFQQLDRKILFCNDVGHAYLAFGSDNRQLLEFSSRLAPLTGMLHVYQTTDFFDYKTKYKQILSPEKTPDKGYIDYQRLKNTWKQNNAPIKYVIQELGKEVIGNKTIVIKALQSIKKEFSNR